jgi:OmpA-OmpF porin, OOP family
MAHINRMVVSVAVAAAFSPALAAEKPWGGRPGYVVDTQNAPVTSGAGHCWKTTDWTPALAVEPCDPVPRKVVVAPEPKPAPPPPQVQAAPPPPPPPKIVTQSVELAADTLFPFDGASLQPEGESALNNFARQLSDVRVNSVVVVGHADRIGPPEYNQKLSERRAVAVKEYLASAVNIPPDRINVEPKGATEPVTRREDCRGLGGEEAIACLAPDRRVTVEVTGTKEVKESPQR